MRKPLQYITYTSAVLSYIFDCIYSFAVPDICGVMSAKKSSTKEELERKRRLAFTLYVDNGFDQKVIAGITAISEQSISAWKKKDAANGLDWDEERRIALMGPDKQMRRIMKLYDKMLTEIEERETRPTNSEADVLNKLADSVKKLSADLTQFVKSEVGKQYIAYIQQTYGQAKAIDAVESWHEYLMATS